MWASALNNGRERILCLIYFDGGDRYVLDWNSGIGTEKERYQILGFGFGWSDVSEKSKPIDIYKFVAD